MSEHQKIRNFIVARLVANGKSVAKLTDQALIKAITKPKEDHAWITDKR